MEDEAGNKLSLPCNDGDDLNEVAVKFVEGNKLPVEFVKTIEQFLRQQVEVETVSEKT